MTPSLLSAFKQSRVRSIPENCEHIYRNVFNFFLSIQGLRLLTFIWIYWTSQKYTLLQQRPANIFWFNDKLAGWIMPELPGSTLFYTVVTVAIATNLVQLIYLRNMAGLQFILALCLLWLNLPHWGYGFLSHVNHTLLLSHLFLIFIPVSRQTLKSPDKYIHSSINWFYAGILFTYTLAGLWKIPSLLFKLITFSPDAHWLHHYGPLFNAFVSYRNFDLNFDFGYVFTDYTLFWQVSFLLTVYFQSISIFGAFRQPLRPWIGLILIVFHVMNMIVFLTYFVVATLLIICLFTPYDLLLQSLYKRYTATEKAVESTDIKPVKASPLSSFEQYRNRLLNRNYYLSGILYLPGLRTISRMSRHTRHKH